MGNRWRRPVRCALVAAATIAATLVAAPAMAEGPGTPHTWGTNTYGQLGDGSTHFTPAPVPGLDDVIDLHAGREHVIALVANGTVRTWGRNNFGQLGVSGGSRQSPTGVPGLSDVIAVETGHNHSIALGSDGTVWTWGYNVYGQLGDGTTTHRSTPAQVIGIGDAVAIAGGRDMSYAIRSDGTVWGWGLNTSGQLGDGTTTNRTTPVRVGVLTDVEAIAGGRDHGLAVRANGTVWAWGANNHGQIGDGTRVNRTSPVQVSTGAVDVIAGAHHSFALLANETVQSWGRNNRAQLGDGTTQRRTSPVSVSGITNAVAIGTGRDHGLAVLTDGTVRAWGFNDSGQLGDGTTTNRTTPIAVAGLDDAEIVSGGRTYSVALVTSGGPPPPNQAPTARIAADCSGLSCTFSGATSSDADGSIVGYSWTFGDGDGASGVSPQHTYAAPGTYMVTLVVTDDDGATDEATTQVTVDEEPPPPNQPPTAQISTGCSGLSCTFSGATSSDPDGSIVGYSWTFGDGDGASGVSPQHTYAAPGTYTVTLFVTDDDGATDEATTQVAVDEITSEVAFRAAAATNGNTVTSQLTIPAAVQAGDQLVLVVTINKNADLMTPAGWSVLGNDEDGRPDMVSWLLTRTAPAGLGGTAVAVTTSARAKKAVTLVAYSGAAPVTLAGSASESGSSSSHTTPAIGGVPDGSFVVGYWSDKTGGSSWTVPGSMTELATSSGSGGGQINAVVAQEGPVGAGTWLGATATSTTSASKAIMWTIVITPG